MQPRTFITPSTSTNVNTSPPGSFTFATLPTATQMTAEIIGVQAYTTDAGICYWNGTAWVPHAASFPQTPAEVLANVSPSNPSYGTQPYDFRRYGALFNNSADDTTAVNTALTVAGTSVNGADGGTTIGPTGVSFLNTMVTLPDRVHVVGQNKRGTVFKAKAGFSVGAAYSATTSYSVGQYATSGGILYISTVNANLNHSPPNTSFWLPISQALFYANNGFTGGTGNSMFDSTLERLTVDCANTVNVGGVLASAWQEDCGLRGVLVTNIGDFGVRFQDGFGGASLSRVVDTEIFGGTILGQTITGISRAASAVVTVSTVSTLNPFTVNGYISFTGVSGMTQINGLPGKVTAIGGSSGAWTATVNINSTAFSAWTSGGNAGDIVGVDLSNPMGLVGAFMLDVSGTTVAGASGNIGVGIACNGNSLLARQLHIEFCEHGVLVDGVGHVTIDDMTGGTTVTNLVTIATNFVGTLRMRNCRRNGSTNFLNDLRSGQISTLGAITAGTLYTTGTYTGVPLTGGTGIDAQATITVAGGGVTVVTVTQPGVGYVANDTLSAAAANIGGTGSGFSVPVSTIFTGLGVITGQDCPDVLINAGDVGNVLVTGISAVQNVSSAASIATYQTPAATSSIVAIQADTSSGYVGTTNSGKNTVITSANNLTLTMGANKTVTAAAPTGTNQHTFNSPSGNPALQVGDSAGALHNAGYLESPINTQATPYTAVLADSGKTLYFSATGPATFTIPANGSVAYPVGTQLTFVNDASAANSMTIAITTDTLVLSPGGTTGSRTLAQFGKAVATKVATTRWVISGSGLT